MSLRAEFLSEKANPLDLSKTLPDARRMVLQLPGADYYINSAQEQLEAAHLEDPEIDTSPDAINEKALEALIGEVIDEIDADTMQTHTSHRLGWSDAQGEAFFSQPGREPFKSKIELSCNPEEKRYQLLTIGTYLRLKYEQALAAVDAFTGDDAQIAQKKAQEQAARRGQLFSLFYAYSLDNLFAPAALAYEDKVNGIDPGARRKGKIKPSKETLAILKWAATAVGGEQEADQLYHRMLKATEGGYFNLVDVFLRNYQGDVKLRQALEWALKARLADQELAIEKLQLLWEAETYREDLGLDLDLFYQFMGLPDTQTTHQRLTAFLENEEVQAEALAHLANEVPAVVEQWQARGGLIKWGDILQALAMAQELPDRPLTKAQLEAKVKEVDDQLRSLLPFAFVDSPTCHLRPTYETCANHRAVTIFYYNQEGDLVTVIGVTPRVKLEQYRAAAGHERGHHLHDALLAKAVKRGFISKEEHMQVPRRVSEDFAGLVEDQVSRILNPKSEGEAGEVPITVHFENATDVLRLLRQAPYGQTQGAVRQEMEAIRRQRVSDKREPLTAQEAETILGKLQPLVRKWYQATGIDYGAYTNLAFNIDPTMPLDGTVYLGRYLREPAPRKVQDEVAPEIEEIIDLKTAYETRFGPEWLGSQKARAVLMGQMIESGKNHAITQDGSWVLEADPQKEITRLLSWGLTTDQI